MIEGNLRELADALAVSEIPNSRDSVSFSGLSIDTRTIKKDNLFVAIIGENTDGHKYLEDAEQAGASGYVIEKSCWKDVSEEIIKKALIVEDTKKALRDISLWWKAKFNPEFVAITGTNGKTTTKEMTAEVLSKKYNVLRSPGNYNNLYGIPLSLCMLDDAHEICVFELGMSFPGEIEILTRMIKPDFVLITNIGPAHLETMGSIENIARAKFELLENCPLQATRILNIDDPILAKRFESEPSPKISYAVNAKADIMPSGFSSNSYGRIIYEFEGESIHLNAAGMHNLYNSLAACAIGKEFGIETNAIKSALESYRSSNSRMQIHEFDKAVIIDDSYNANPTSMKYALTVLHDIDDSGRKIALLGDMKELGEDEIRLHQEIGTLVASLNPDVLITVGKLGMHIASQANVDGFDPARTFTFLTAKEASEYMIENLKEQDHILVKASRAMGFEKIINDLKDYLGKVA